MLSYCVVEGFSTCKQLSSHLSSRTENQIRMCGGMVADNVPRACYSPGDLGPSNYISAHHEKRRSNSVLIQNLEQSGGVTIIWAVIER